MSLYAIYMQERRNGGRSKVSNVKPLFPDAVGVRRVEKERQRIAGMALKRFAERGFSGTMFHEIQNMCGLEAEISNPFNDVSNWLSGR